MVVETGNIHLGIEVKKKVTGQPGSLHVINCISISIDAWQGQNEPHDPLVENSYTGAHAHRHQKVVHMVSKAN